MLHGSFKLFTCTVHLHIMTGTNKLSRKEVISVKGVRMFSRSVVGAIRSHYKRVSGVEPCGSSDCLGGRRWRQRRTCALFCTVCGGSSRRVRVPTLAVARRVCCLNALTRRTSTQQRRRRSLLFRLYVGRYQNVKSTVKVAYRQRKFPRMSVFT